jgi:hypothetical protein
MEEESIKELANTYNLKAKVWNDLIIVTSKFDEWIIEVKANSFVLKHQNVKRNKTGKHKEHLQKVFTDKQLRDVLKFIKGHDKDTIKKKHTEHDRLFKKLEEHNKMCAERSKQIRA